MFQTFDFTTCVTRTRPYYSEQDVHPKIVSERLGHASIAITLDTYSHVSPSLQRAAAARIDEWLDDEVQHA